MAKKAIVGENKTLLTKERKALLKGIKKAADKRRKDPDAVENARKMVEKWEAEQAAEKAAENNAVAVAVEAINGKCRLDIVAARLFEQHKCPTLYIEWMLEQFWGNRMPQMIACLDAIYAKLQSVKATEKKPVNYNDADDDMFIIANKSLKILVHKSQNTRFLFIWRKDTDARFQRLHIRRFYDKWVGYKEDEVLYQFEVDEIEELAKDIAKQGFSPAIKQADKFSQYADDILGNPYPHRPSLQFFKQAKFEPRYGDCRDVGYIGSWDAHTGKVDRAIYHHEELKILLECYIPSMMAELELPPPPEPDEVDDKKTFDSK